MSPELHARLALPLWIYFVDSVELLIEPSLNTKLARINTMDPQR